MDGRNETSDDEIDTSDPRIAATCLSDWLPFLSKDLCDHSSTFVPNRLRSLNPISNTEMVSTTIDLVNLDVLKNIVARLPAVSFAYAACVSRSWNVACSRVLCRPKLSSACLRNESLYVAVEGVLDKVLSEPIRPHFALASVGSWDWLEEAHQLITAKLGSKIPLITTFGEGCFGRDASSNEIVERGPRGAKRFHTVTLIIGFLPGIKVKKIPLLEPIKAPGARYIYQASGAPMIDKFIKDIWEFSTSVSGCKSPAAIMMFNHDDEGYITALLQKMDNSLSPETVIVGQSGSPFHRAASEKRDSTVAFVFVVDRNKPSGIGETRFHTISSSGLLPVDPVYTVTAVKEDTDMDDEHFSTLTIRRDGSHENLDVKTIVDQSQERFQMEYGSSVRRYMIGVSKKRKGMTSLAFYEIRDYRKDLSVYGLGIKRGDTFRFYHHPDSSTIALSSVVDVTNHIRFFKQERTTGGDKLEVFGGVVFPSNCRDFSFGSEEPNGENSDSFPFLDNFPGATLGGIFYNAASIARGDLIPFAKEQKPGRCCSLLNLGVVNLILSYDAK